MTDPAAPPPATRLLFVLAGLGALAVTLLRAILGAANDLPLMQQGLDYPDVAAVIRINWHVLTVTFATLALALLAASRLERTAARAIGLIAAIVFAAAAILFMAEAAATTGSPFTYFPFAPLGATALLAGFAAWRA